jgi:hypothetical protein
MGTDSMVYILGSDSVESFKRSDVNSILEESGINGLSLAELELVAKDCCDRFLSKVS